LPGLCRTETGFKVTNSGGRCNLTLRFAEDFSSRERRRKIPALRQSDKKGLTLVIRFENVGLRYGDGPEILRDVNFHIKPGSFHFVTGPSGAGKSSLLKLMYLALRPSRGRINLFGSDLALTPRRSLPDIRRRIGVVFQDFRLLDHMNLFENVALPMRIASVPEQQVSQNVTELMEWVGLGERLLEKPRTLSGGEKQRAAIARAIINKPSLLLADEPTGNVDEALAERLMRLFEELHRTGTAVVVATHNESLMERFPHPRIGLLSHSFGAQEDETISAGGA
jgi:cell division transport system ATP-binding protein